MRWIPVIILLLMMAAGGENLMAQYDPHGSLDSVTIGLVQVQSTGQFTAPVKLINDQEVRAFSIPLNYDKSALVFDSASFLNSRVANWSFLAATHDVEAGAILLGGLSMNDPLLPVGAGPLVNLCFHTAPGFGPGQATAIDSAFVPPAGEFIITAFDNVSIKPAFRSGSVVVVGADLFPVFEPLARRVVNEGQILSVTLRAADPESSPIVLAGENLPPQAELVDNGDGSGQFNFTAPFVGPGSAADSPLRIRFAASAGAATSYLDFEVEVVNVNRPPQFDGSTLITTAAGDTVHLPVVANDPDYERVTLSCNNLPPGAELSSTSPGYLSWISDISDSGSYSLTVLAEDESGASQSQQIQIELSPTVPLDLAISEEQAFGASSVEVTLSLKNRLAVSACRLLLRFDQTALSLDEVSSAGTRLEAWQSFETTFMPGDGLLWIEAEADTLDIAASSLQPGDGVIARLRFITSSDPGLAGYHSRIDFEFLGGDSTADNFFLEPNSSIISYSQIDFRPGGVLIKAYDALIGDINLNNIPFEVADLVYFSNYFINPFDYPLDGARWPNSDINQDGQPGTLADLTYMQSIINGKGGKLGNDVGRPSATYQISSGEGDCSYSLAAAADIAAACFKFAVTDADHIDLLPSAALGNAEIKIGFQGDTLRILLLGAHDRPITASDDELFRLRGAARFQLMEQECVDLLGRTVELKESTAELNLPSSYSLDQNHPNPFNPQTTISFSLPQAGLVKLDVFNVLGKRVRTLVDGHLPAGRHEVSFDGRDSRGHELASGVYFYRLHSGSFESSRKMLLLK